MAGHTAEKIPAMMMEMKLWDERADAVFILFLVQDGQIHAKKINLGMFGIICHEKATYGVYWGEKYNFIVRCLLFLNPEETKPDQFEKFCAAAGNDITWDNELTGYMRYYSYYLQDKHSLFPSASSHSIVSAGHCLTSSSLPFPQLPAEKPESAAASSDEVPDEVPDEVTDDTSPKPFCLEFFQTKPPFVYRNCKAIHATGMNGELYLLVINDTTHTPLQYPPNSKLLDVPGSCIIRFDGITRFSVWTVHAKTNSDALDIAKRIVAFNKSFTIVTPKSGQD